MSTDNSDDEVWGVVYSMPRSSVAHLDGQENQYARIDVDVTLPDGKTVMPCFSYVHHALLGDVTLSPEAFSVPPSLEYLSVIVYGAKQHNLPDFYIKKLEETKTKPKNGQQNVKIFEELVSLTDNKLKLISC